MLQITEHIILQVKVDLIGKNFENLKRNLLFELIRHRKSHVKPNVEQKQKNHCDSFWKGQIRNKY